MGLWNWIREDLRHTFADREPQRYSAAGRPIRCPHCDGVLFLASEFLNDSRGASFMGLEWLSPGATALTCVECTAMQLFAARPTRVAPQS